MPQNIIKLDPRDHFAIAAERWRIVLRETDDEEIRPVPVGPRDRQVAGLGQPLNALKVIPQTKGEIGEGRPVLRFWNQPAGARRDMRAAGFDTRKRRFHIVQDRWSGRARLLRQDFPRRCGEQHDQHRQANPAEN